MKNIIELNPLHVAMVKEQMTKKGVKAKTNQQVIDYLFSLVINKNK